ncbi:hypothetical protein JCM4814A_72530 [Streptomyces phaeofaciens JCM 4814]|uniref:Uncharacterized protein n=1 Tax=Streptomyces phaeofaciens TaxID=68254 RepID=A0A918HGY6_9ACTN|nr:hypothetical protein GCM10010226_44990 [Streptomyces phaeofaciens]
MIVDDQDSDTNHETPFPKLLVRAGDTPRPETENDDRRGYDARGGCRCRTAAAVQRLLTPTAGVVPDCLAP